jgi:hypothetical protein
MAKLQAGRAGHNCGSPAVSRSSTLHVMRTGTTGAGQRPVIGILTLMRVGGRPTTSHALAAMGRGSAPDPRVVVASAMRGIAAPHRTGGVGRCPALQWATVQDSRIDGTMRVGSVVAPHLRSHGTTQRLRFHACSVVRQKSQHQRQQGRSTEWQQDSPQSLS